MRATVEELEIASFDPRADNSFQAQNLSASPLPRRDVGLPGKAVGSIPTRSTKFFFLHFVPCAVSSPSFVSFVVSLPTELLQFSNNCVLFPADKRLKVRPVTLVEPDSTGRI